MLDLRHWCACCLLLSTICLQCNGGRVAAAATAAVAYSLVCCPYRCPLPFDACSGGLNKSRYRGVSYDRKKAKWRVQIKVGLGAMSMCVLAP